MTSTVRSRVRTLRQAEEFLHREWPGRDAPGPAWLAYHQHAAELYAHVARVDADHHHEALYRAGCERDAAIAVTHGLLDSAADGEVEPI